MNCFNPGDRILNSYIVESVLGEGGFSTVYLVRRITDGQYFSLKAVNTSKMQSDGIKRSLFSELRTWIDLPEHRNITQCRFFKTVRDCIGIFAEYVDGGTLTQWIASGKFQTMETVLDVAIQCCSGLRVAHGQGVIHQDVKPSNILMTRAGIPKITDFGISSIASKASAGETRGGGASSSPRSSTTGYTLAYCSPEQFFRKEITPATDIWSFGILLAELITGKQLTEWGYLADEALVYELLENRDKLPPYATDRMLSVISLCLKKNPSERWDGFGSLADALKDIYLRETGAPYAESTSDHAIVLFSNRRKIERRTSTGVRWDNPAVWLERAYLISGRDPEEMTGFLKNKPRSPVAMTFFDLEIYDITQEIYESPDVQRHPSAGLDLAHILMNKALICEHTSDWNGAVSARRKAIRILEDLVYNKNNNDFANELADVYVRHGWVLTRAGDIRQGVDFYDKALAIREALARRESGGTLSLDLAKTYMNKGIALAKQKNSFGFESCFDKAEALMEELLSREPTTEHAKTLATIYLNRAIAHQQLGQVDRVMACFDRAIDITRRYVPLDSGAGDSHFICKFYLNRARVAKDIGDYIQAFRDLKNALKILEKKVYQEEVAELAPDLAEAYTIKGAMAGVMGNLRSAALLINEAITMREYLMYVEGREDQAANLARLYTLKARMLMDRRNPTEALGLLKKASDITSWQVFQNRRDDLREELIDTYFLQAELCGEQKDFYGAVAAYHSAENILKHLVYQENRKDLFGSYARTKCLKAAALFETGNYKKGKNYLKEGIELLKTGLKRNPDDALQSFYEWVRFRFDAMKGVIQ